MSDPATAAQTEPQAFMRSVLQRIATGPEYSKDLPQEEARAALNLILNGQADPVQAGIFFIALRMKRETLEENTGVLEALHDHTVPEVADVAQVVDVAEPYDGFVRGLPMGAFLPAVLSACGVPSICHGAETVGPKFGVTPRQILRACGADVDRPTREAAARVGEAECGWSYVDQSQFCPALHQLLEFRTRIVKRPVLTTVEVLLAPVRGREATHLVTGYVHKPYPPVYAHLARAAGFDSALIVRGVEGGIFPSLKQAGKAFGLHGKDEETEWDFHADDLDFAHDSRAVPLPDSDMPAEKMAQAAAETGLAALGGQAGPAKDSLQYAAAMILAHLDGSRDIRRHYPTACEAIDSGRARARFEAGL